MKKIFLLLLVSIMSTVIYAQKYYAVKVADDKTEVALNRATVLSTASQAKAVTNESGTTIIMASPGDILRVSCAGYVTQEVTLSSSVAVHVFLAKIKIKKAKTRSS